MPGSTDKFSIHFFQFKDTRRDEKEGLTTLNLGIGIG